MQPLTNPSLALGWGFFTGSEPVKHLLPALVAVLGGLAFAADPPPVPDPLGLGERLALIDHLQTVYGLAPAPGASTEDLQAAYAAAWRRTQPAATDDQRDAADRLRRRLQDRFRIEPDAQMDLAGLQALWEAQEAAKNAADAEVIRRRLEAPDGPLRTTPATSLPRPAVNPTPATIDPPPTTTTVTRLRFPADGVADCRLFGGAKPLLGVQFGHPRGGEFRGIFEYAAALMATSRGPTAAVLLLGHGTGTSIAGEPIAVHLRRHRTFYETLGGTRAAVPLDCLIVASCSRGNGMQMGEIREGLGYYPTWRVATGDRTYANGPTVLAALRACIAEDARTPYRALFRWGTGEDSPVSVAEAGRDGARGDLRHFSVTLTDGTVQVTER